MTLPPPIPAPAAEAAAKLEAAAVYFEALGRLAKDKDFNGEVEQLMGEAKDYREAARRLREVQVQP